VCEVRNLSASRSVMNADPSGNLSVSPDFSFAFCRNVAYSHKLPKILSSAPPHCSESSIHGCSSKGA
jgi:hypothetical protein